MTDLVVSLLDAPLTRALLDPAQWPDGLDVDLRTAPSVDANSRAMSRLEFDVAEMSFATYLRARLADAAPLLALPAFTGRRFPQPSAGIGPRSAVRRVADLPGRRVAVPQYWMTSSVWHRIVLRDFYGVDPAGITWVTTEAERFDHAPDGGKVERCDDGRAPQDLVGDGDADVLLSPRPRPAGLLPLFSDDVAEQHRYYRQTGVFPLLHLVVVRSDLDGGLIADVWARLLAARQAARPGPAVPGLPAADVAGLFAGDPWSYGLDANIRSLAALRTGAHRDGLLTSVPRVEDLFFPEDRLVPTR